MGLRKDEEKKQEVQEEIETVYLSGYIIDFHASYE